MLQDPLSLGWLAPFGAYILAIAVVAVVFDLAHTFWHKRNYWEELTWPKVALAVAAFVPVAVWATQFGKWKYVAKEAQHLIEFLCVMLPFMAVAYSISVKAALRPTPVNNAFMLLLGGVVGAAVGTPAASLVFTMLLLKMNAERQYVGHLWLFVIVAISNVPGTFLPVSTPLVVGMQAENGIPAGWYARTLFAPWLTLQLIVTFGFLLVDLYQWGREDETLRRGPTDAFGEAAETPAKGGALFDVTGAGNVVVLACMTGLVMMEFPEHLWWLKCAALVGLAGVGCVVPGAKEARRMNGFTTMPFKEITAVFAGIFLTLPPCFLILKARGAEMGLTTPTEFFVVTGGLSAILDNAPTYLLFLTVAGAANPGPNGPLTPAELATAHVALAKAISMGAALWGCMTYIGNGPNLAVRSVVTGAGRKMPNFALYVPLAGLIFFPLVALPAWLLFIR